MKNSEIDKAAKTIWDYMVLGQSIKKSDVILVIGSNDIRVAERGADLFLLGMAPYLVVSGGRGVLTPKHWRSEAEMFAQTMIKKGVSEEKIYLETKSANTAENFMHSLAILKEKGIKAQSFIIVTKPYMERRAYATFKKLFPNLTVTVTSPQLSFANYPNAQISKDLMINIMVGDLQRIKLYPKQGFSVEQVIPPKVWAAFETLVAIGYTEHLIG